MSARGDVDLGEKMIERNELNTKRSGKRRTPIAKVIHSKLVAVKHEDSGVETDVSPTAQMGIGPVIVHPAPDPKNESPRYNLDVTSPTGIHAITDRLETFNLRPETIVKSVSTGNLSEKPQYTSDDVQNFSDEILRKKKSLSPPLSITKVSSCVDLTKENSGGSGKPTSKWFIDFDPQDSDDSILSSNKQPPDLFSSGRTTRSSNKDSSADENLIRTPRSYQSPANPASISSRQRRQNFRRQVFIGSHYGQDSVISNASVRSISSNEKGSKEGRMDGSTGSIPALLTPVSVKQARQR